MRRLAFPRHSEAGLVTWHATSVLQVIFSSVALTNGTRLGRCLCTGKAMRKVSGIGLKTVDKLDRPIWQQRNYAGGPTK